MTKKMFEKINLFEKSSISFMINILHYIGILNNYSLSAMNKNRYKIILFKIYTTIVHSIMILYLVLHLLRTLCISTRSFSEFSQSLMEDFTFHSLYYHFTNYRRNIAQMREVDSLLKCLSKADMKIVEKCNLTCKNQFFISTVWMTILCAGITLQKYFALPTEFVHDLDIPQRSLAMKLYVQFIYETEIYHYKILFSLEVYVIMVLFNLSTCVLSTLVPTIIIYVEGQYKMLCKYTEKIGKRHYNSERKEIFYTNIEKNEYLLLETLRYRFKTDSSAILDIHDQFLEKNCDETFLKNKISNNLFNSEEEILRVSTGKNKGFGKLRDRKICDLRNTKQTNTATLVEVNDKIVSYIDEKTIFEDYDKHYVRQIIKFHQKLLCFQEKVSIFTLLRYVACSKVK